MSHFVPFLPLLIALPWMGFVWSLIAPRRSQSQHTWAGTITLIQLVFSTAFITLWWTAETPALLWTSSPIYETHGFSFFMSLFIDRTSTAFWLVGNLMIYLIARFSRFYLQGEEGARRYFSYLYLFYAGYTCTVLSGNFETFFLGWEILGLSSFLLIAFYRTRYLPVKNAVKVFSIYRIGDLGIVLAMWLAHHTWHTNLTFNQLSLADGAPALAHPWTHLIIIGCIVVAAAAKSAQLPFTSWLPRAMEGPTPSSAVFYGALSVHMGIFLLIRTYPMWHHATLAKVVIALLGACTALLAYWTARAQPSIKAKIAYRSASQIGLMFIEVALGWHWLALLHFTANALVRAYQLLISPSVVSYLIKKQGYAPLDQTDDANYGLTSTWRRTLYAKGLFEWNLDQTLSHLLWRPIKVVGQWFQWLHIRSVLIWFSLLYLTSWVMWAFRAHLHHGILNALTYLLAAASLALVIKSLHERRRARISWLILVLSHGMLAQAALMRPDFGVQQGLIYLSGVVISGSMGYAILWRLYKRERSIKLSKFNGHVYEYPRLALGFLLATLGISGFPITPTFLGEDLILAGVLPHQVLLITLFALNFLLMSLAAMRIYAKVFLGPHLKNYHSTAHRSG